MDHIVDRIRALRRKLTFEDFTLIVGIMYTNEIVEMLLGFARSVLREII